MKLSVFVKNVMSEIQAGVDEANAVSPSGLAGYPQEVVFDLFVDNDTEVRFSAEFGHKISFIIPWQFTKKA